MKNLFTLFILLAAATAAHAQAFSANYTYDANGNRLTARIIWLQTSLKDDVVDTSVVVQTHGRASLTNATDTVTVPKHGYTTPSLDSLAGTKITVYPNPTHGILLVQLQGFDMQATNTIAVYDINGQQLLHISPLTQLNSVNLLAKPAGTYVMMIELGGQTKTFTIIKN